MGGAERQALYFVEHLAKSADYSVEVLSFTDGPAIGDALDRLSVKAHVLPYNDRWPARKRVRSLARMAWHVRGKVRPDCLLPFGTPTSKAMALAWPYTGARFCWWNQQDEGREIYGTPRERQLLNAVSCITSNSEIGRDKISQTFQIHPDRILVYNNGTPIPDGKLPASNWRETLKLESRPVVTMIANITRFKDHLTLLDAWKKVQSSLALDVAPVLLLAGNMLEKSRVSELKQHAFDIGLSSSHLRFLGQVKDVLGLILESDLVVHSSLTEGCPNAVCEAMSLGVAVVATDIPGCRQALGSQNQRWLTEPGNSSMMADRIIELLESKDLRGAVGNQNRTRIASDFTINGMNAFFEQQIRNGLADLPRRRRHQ